MWIKLARNPLWLAFCVGASTIAYCRDAAQREARRVESVYKIYGITMGKTLDEQGVYSVSREYRQWLNDRYPSSAHFQQRIDVFKFPRVSSVRPMPDTVIIATGQHGGAVGSEPVYDFFDGPRFTVFAPWYMTKGKVNIDVYDSSRNSHRLTMVDGFVVASQKYGIMRATYEIPQNEPIKISRAEITIAP